MTCQTPVGVEVLDRDAVVAVARFDLDALDARQLAGLELDPVVSGRAPADERVVAAVTEVDPDAVEAVAAGLEVDHAVVAEVDLEPAALVQGEPVVGGRAGDVQRALHDPRAAVGGDLDELALAVARSWPA